MADTRNPDESRGGRPCQSVSDEAGTSYDLGSGLSLPREAVRFTFVRSSGPGGQNVNKLNTKACLHVAMTDLAAHCGLDEPSVQRLRLLARTRINADDEIVIQSSRHRSQRQNRQECLNRLGQLVVVALKPPVRRLRSRPSRSAIERRLSEKRQRSETKKQRKQIDDRGLE